MMDYVTLFNISLFTITQALLSMAISCTGGFILARYLFAYPNTWLENLVSLPLVLPSISIVIGFSSMMSNQHLFHMFGLSGILLCHVFLNLPLAALIILKGYHSIPSSVWRLSSACRTGWRISLFKVEIPLLTKTLLKTASLIFLYCFSSFTIPLMMGGGPTNSTLAVLLYYALIIQGNLTAAFYLLGLKISVGAFIISLIGLPLEQPIQAVKAAPHRPAALHLPPFLKGITLLLPLLLFLPPLSSLGVQLIQDVRYLKWPLDVGSALQNSLLIAFISAATVIVLTSLILFMLPRQRYWLEKIGYLMLIFPSFLIGVLLFCLSVIIFGTVIHAFPALLITNTLMGIPIALKILSPAFSKIHKNYGPLYTCLRLNKWARMRWIYGPLLTPAFKLSFALVMAYSLGDLGSILLFNQDELQTLPALIYEAYSHFDLPLARSLSALLLAIVAVIFFISKVKIFHYAQN